jgi:hypothetical protein
MTTIFSHSSITAFHDMLHDHQGNAHVSVQLPEELQASSISTKVRPAIASSEAGVLAL